MSATEENVATETLETTERTDLRNLAIVAHVGELIQREREIMLLKL